MRSNVKDMERQMKAIREEALARSFIKTHQGVVRKPGTPLKLVFDGKVTSNSPDPYLAIRKHIDRCVDASVSAYIDKNHDMLEDACKTYFKESIKEIGSKIASYQRYNIISTFAFTQHIHNIMDGSTGIYTADSS